MKKKIMTKKNTGSWRLVISIHGSDDVIATKGGNLKDKSAEGVYEAKELEKLFVDDQDFEKWRSSYGSTWTTLNACQVHSQFEAVILKSFNKPKSKQRAQGLGNKCRPATVVDHFYPDGSDTAVKTRSQWRQLSKEERSNMKEALRDINKNFGYFGGPPVDEPLLLDYYFDEEPLGGWPKVTVSFERRDTGISFHNRTSNTRFLGEKCSKHMGPMRGRKATTPPVPVN